jgi:hypothetical protein
VQATTRALAAAWLAGAGLAAPETRFRTADPAAAASLGEVRWLDERLLVARNEIDWGAIEAEAAARFDGAPAQVIEREGWVALRRLLSTALVAILLAPGVAALGADVMRLLLVMELVEGVAAGGQPDRAEVLAALRWRTVVLPREIMRLPFIRRSVLARRPGVADLYVVREEWARYELGEIAHIENVLRGEVKRSLLERTDEQETTLTTETARTRQSQQDTQTTDRFELKQSSQTDTSLAFHIDGKVDTSGV